MESFALRRARWAFPFLALFAPRGGDAQITDDGRLTVHMGLLGSADIDLEGATGVGFMRWPWWGGLGVRIGRGMVAYVGDTGEAVVINFDRDVSVRAPLRWQTRRVVIATERPAHFAAAVAAAAGLAPPSP